MSSKLIYKSNNNSSNKTMNFQSSKPNKDFYLNLFTNLEDTLATFTN